MARGRPEPETIKIFPDCSSILLVIVGDPVTVIDGPVTVIVGPGTVIDGPVTVQKNFYSFGL